MSTRRILASSLAALALALPSFADFIEGDIYICDRTNSRVYRLDALTYAGSVFLGPADGLNGPGALGFTEAGTLLVANFDDDTVWEYDSQGNGKQVLSAADGLSGPFGGNAVVIGDDGRVYIGNFNSSEILRFDLDYTNGVVWADGTDGIIRPDGMGFLADGDMLVANRGTNAVFQFDPTGGSVSTFDVIPGEVPAAVVIRKNFDVYVRTLSGNIYRYIGGFPSARNLLGNYGGSGAGGSLGMPRQGDQLITCSQSDPTVYVIDPDTGSAHAVALVPGWQPTALAVVGSQHPPGSIWSFGSGVAGAGGFEPTLTSPDTARIGTTVAVEAYDFVGGATVFVAVSFATATAPLLGGTTHINFGVPLFVVVPLVAPGSLGVPGEGDLDISYPIPADPSFVSVRQYWQAAAVDAVAPQLASLTNCMTMHIGL